MRHVTKARVIWSCGGVALGVSALFSCADESPSAPEDGGRDAATTDLTLPDSPAGGDVTSEAPSDTSAGDGSSPYTIKILSPANGATIVVPRAVEAGAPTDAGDAGDAATDGGDAGAAADAGPPPGKVQFTWETNLTVMPAHTCGETPNCGHAHLYIDGTDCNSPFQLADGGTITLPYNAPAYGSPFYGDLTTCKKGLTGTKLIRLELRQDNHAPLAVPVFQEITLTFQ
jgi:hypothetical protein